MTQALKMDPTCSLRSSMVLEILLVKVQKNPIFKCHRPFAAPTRRTILASSSYATESSCPMVYLFGKLNCLGLASMVLSNEHLEVLTHVIRAAVSYGEAHRISLS